MIGRVIGIDFSGARNAGNFIWIAESEIRNRQLNITKCFPAAELPGAGVARDNCLAALVAYIAAQRNVVIGCDFPFSLPAQMVAAADWQGFATDFAERYGSAELFMADCRRRANGRELKRACDRAAKVPFSSYNVRIYRQTFHGIRDFLAPLVRDHRARVIPMQSLSARHPALVETCPASTLKSVRLYLSYKGRGPDPRRARRAIVKGLMARGILPPLPPEVERIAIENKGGDALDSIIAACATARCLMSGQFAAGRIDPVERLEGRVYF